MAFDCNESSFPLANIKKRSVCVPESRRDPTVRIRFHWGISLSLLITARGEDDWGVGEWMLSGGCSKHLYVYEDKHRAKKEVGSSVKETERTRLKL